MVLPEVSGIMFTADPVSGLVSPDIYKFKKSSVQIDSKIIAKSKKMLIFVEILFIISFGI